MVAVTVLHVVACMVVVDCVVVEVPVVVCVVRATVDVTEEGEDCEVIVALNEVVSAVEVSTVVVSALVAVQAVNTQHHK